MEAKRLEERLGPNRIEDPSTTKVEAIFRERAPGAGVIQPLYEQFGTHRALAVALVATAVVVLWTMGYAMGGGFSGADGAAAGSEAQQVVIDEQAALLDQQSIELRDTHSSLAVAEGESAFLSSQMALLNDETDRMQASLNAAQIEMRIVVGIYEECLDRLYPADCIESAKPAAEAFLEEFYAEAP